MASVATSFPSGKSPLEVRLAEVHWCVDHGASEIDMVIERGAFLAGEYAQVFDEIAAVKEACGGAHASSIVPAPCPPTRRLLLRPLSRRP